MFKKGKRVKFEAARFEKQGMYNSRLHTNDYCCIAIWSAGGSHQRYIRLKDTTLRVPPLESDQKFRVGHDAKRLFYVGKQDGVNKLVIIYLKDLTHEFIDLGADADRITTFEGASLFKNYICYPIESKNEVRAQGKTLWRWTKNFRVFDYREANLVWELDDCEYVLFCGMKASELKTVKFKEMLKKLRTEPPEESEEEEEEAAGDDDFKPELNTKVEDVDDLDSDADEEEQKNCDSPETWATRVFRLYNGIMVIKSKFIDRKNEDEKKPAAEGEAEADGEDGADAADKDGAQ